MGYYNLDGFALEIKEKSFDIILNDITVFSLVVVSKVNTDSEDTDVDILVKTETVVNEAQQKRIVAVWTTESNIWSKKEYVLEVSGNYFIYYVRVFGDGMLRKIEFFSPEKEKNSYETYEYFLPTAPFGGVENRHFAMTESKKIDLGYMVPPPLCFSFSTEGMEEKIGISLVANPGEYNFASFDYNYNPDKFDFSFSTDYKGYTKVENVFETCKIMGIVGNSDSDVLEKYSRWHFDNGYCEKNKNKAEKPDWWKGPLFCGWGEQCYLNPNEPGKLATQEVYEEMSRMLDVRKIKTTAIIIDDKWQDFFGSAMPDESKWHDMRTFVEQEHKKGRHVLLWFKLWNGEGVTDQEQIQKLCRPVGPDPTNEVYRARVKSMMYKLLSADEGCYNCDGFKLDFANCMPLGENIKTQKKGIYGIELLKSMLDLVYTSAKAVKPTALINNSCVHPYFIDVTDQVRLHDYHLGARNAVTTLRNRSEIVKAVMGDILIDTDGPNCMSRRDTMRYLTYAPNVGVPDLYFITNEILTNDDWKAVGEAYDKYHAQQREDV